MTNCVFQTFDAGSSLSLVYLEIINSTSSGLFRLPLFANDFNAFSYVCIVSFVFPFLSSIRETLLIAGSCSRKTGKTVFAITDT